VFVVANQVVDDHGRPWCPGRGSNPYTRGARDFKNLRRSSNHGVFENIVSNLCTLAYTPINEHGVYTMASIIHDKKTGLYRALIRRDGHPTASRSGFSSRKDAVEWALVVETKMLQDVELPKKNKQKQVFPTLADALDGYAATVTVKKKSLTSQKRELSRIALVKKNSIAKKTINSITPADLTAFMTERMNAGAGSSALRSDLMLFSALYKHRIKVNHDDVMNPVHRVLLPRPGPGRERVLRSNELEYLKKGLVAASPRTKYIAQLIDLAVLTGMRQSEILKITGDDVDIQNRFIFLPMTKSGVPREVPLSPPAIEILKSIDLKPEKKLFRITQSTLIRNFKKACDKGREFFEIENGEKPDSRFLIDLKFHDLRHEAASRISKYLHAQELARMFGWKTLDLVMHYYKSDTQAIADKIKADRI